MTTVARLCRRLELWTGLQCANGERVGLWPAVIAAVADETLTLDSQLVLELPLDAAASKAVRRWMVVRVWEDDETWDEWVVTRRGEEPLTNRLSLTCGPVTILLGRAGLVAELPTPDGEVRHEVERVGLPPATLLQTLVLDQCTRLGLPWLTLGPVDSTAPVDLSIAWATPLEVLQALASVASLEADVVRQGTSGYAIALRTRINADATVLQLRHTANLLELGQDAQVTEHATVMAAKGASSDGVAATIARATWQVASVAGVTVALADPAGGAGPIGWDGQLDGLSLRAVDGSLWPIAGSYADTQTVRLEEAGTFTVEDLVEVRTSDGADVVSLACPPAVAEYGPIFGLLPREDLAGHRNLVPNPVTRDWPTGDTLPSGWTRTAPTVTITRITEGPFITRGPSSMQVAATAAGFGVTTPSAVCTPTAGAPYLNGYVTLWVVTGQVRVELVGVTSRGEVKVYPTGGALATSSAQGVWTDLGLTGIDARGADLVSAALRVVQHGATPATFVVASAQLTLGAGDGQLPFVEGSGGTQLWQAVNAALVSRAIPRLVTSVSLADLARLDPARWREDTTVTVGGLARIQWPDRAIDVLVRVVRVSRDLLVPGRTAITLSDRAEQLSATIVRRATVERRTPTTPPATTPTVPEEPAAGSPRFTALAVTGPAPGEGPVDLAVTFTVADTPSGFTVDLQVVFDGSVQLRSSVTSPEVLRTDTYGSSGSTHPYVFSTGGTAYLLDSGGAVLATREIPAWTYYIGAAI